jgi:hypothetical protein
VLLVAEHRPRLAACRLPWLRHRVAPASLLVRVVGVEVDQLARGAPCGHPARLLRALLEVVELAAAPALAHAHTTSAGQRGETKQAHTSTQAGRQAGSARSRRANPPAATTASPSAPTSTTTAAAATAPASATPPSPAAAVTEVITRGCRRAAAAAPAAAAVPGSPDRDHPARQLLQPAGTGSATIKHPSLDAVPHDTRQPPSPPMPTHTCWSMVSMASCTASASANTTKPKPRLSPLSRSVTTSAVTTCQTQPRRHRHQRT